MPIKRQVSCAIALIWACAAGAQTVSPLRTTVETAVNTNPEVTARFNAYRAAIDATDVARSGLLPHLDLAASVGTNQEVITSNSPQTQTLPQRQAGLTLSQLLWDGLGTANDVARAGHDRLARYFELLDTTEQTALEAARAHFDVQRYRRLVHLAEDSYVQHRYTYLQIQSRVKAGVGRGVDLEQAAARVALAESNLVTETANLHDVTVRYQRIVGVAPPAALPTIEMLRSGIPATQTDASTLAIRQSPAVSASIEGLRAARATVDTDKSAYQPKVEARLRSAAGKNVDLTQNQNRLSTAEIALSWNLFNGGADQSRVRQQVRLLGQAQDLRDKTCRDTYQTAAIAFNDIRKLQDQLIYLERNTLSIEKARDAYRQQFDIGQRSLLDLLNAENEVFTARRAYANAEYDLGYAYARTLAAMNVLGSQLGVSRVDNVATDAAGWQQGDDAPTRCPVLVATTFATDRQELEARAQRLAATAPSLPAPATKP